MTIYVVNEPLVVTIEGREWGSDAAAELARQLRLAYDHPDVIIDLSAVEYLDSAALTEFVRKRKARAAHGWEPSRLVLTPLARALFETVGFDRIWPIFPTLNKALWDATG